MRAPLSLSRSTQSPEKTLSHSLIERSLMVKTSFHLVSKL